MPDPSGRVQAYQVPCTAAPIDLHLDRNEGDHPPAWLFDALREAGLDVLRSYPDVAPLQHRLAELRGVSPDQVLVTAGGDESIDRFFRATLRAGQEAVVPVPTFDMIEPYTRLAGGAVRAVPWPEGPFPVDAVLRAVGPQTAAIVVISPNNPTGAVAPAKDLLRLAAEAPHSRLLVDAAYAEFADEDLTTTALTIPQAVVIRTLSKCWVLAGLRVGYALGHPDVIARLRASAGPFTVAAPSLMMAEARLRADGSDVETFVNRVKRERERLAEHLRALGGEPLPSQANFVLVRLEHAERTWRGLAGLGIAVRAFPNRAGLENSLRITCPGRPEVFDRLLAGLDAVMAPEALLFDMDGVLADVSGSYRQAILATARGFGVPLTPADISAAKAAGSANNDWELTRRLLADRGLEIPIDLVTERFEALYQGTADAPGLCATERLTARRDVFERLSARLPLGVVTGRPLTDAMRFLNEAGVAELFPTVVCMEDAPLKPDPAPVKLALARMGVRSAWMVGDTPDDLRAARGAGVVPVGIVGPGDDPASVEPSLLASGAAWVLKTIDELEALLP